MLRFCFLLLLLFCACQKNKDIPQTNNFPAFETADTSAVSLILLGTTQDAGSPQINCNKNCCTKLFEHPDHTRKVIALGLIDTYAQKSYLFEATPDISSQLQVLKTYTPTSKTNLVDGIFLTHAHIGHYTGLMYLGKEATDADQIPVYTMPRLRAFLTENGPWEQLVTRNNISLQTMENKRAIQLTEFLQITPFMVPHRDEYSETVGYRIQGPSKTALFIPDIDKWTKWDINIRDEVKSVDYAFLDATFYSGEELNNRDMGEIPHPFVLESLETFKDFQPEEKKKIIFIHFNHTNPLLNPESDESKYIISSGYRIGRFKDIFEL
jgi:pyrroloquinoline quinone biosynthesis protein B